MAGKATEKMQERKGKKVEKLHPNNTKRESRKRKKAPLQWKNRHQNRVDICVSLKTVVDVVLVMEDIVPLVVLQGPRVVVDIGTVVVLG